MASGMKVRDQEKDMSAQVAVANVQPSNLAAWLNAGNHAPRDWYDFRDEEACVVERARRRSLLHGGTQPSDECANPCN